MKCLLVIVPDIVSDIIRKGEVTDRYYNPGEVFDEVHLLITNHDQPDLALLQKTVGRARLMVHNLPLSKKSFLQTLGWRPFLLRPLMRPAVDLARQIRPQLVRCHGAFANTFAAYCIKRELGIPYVVSLHINPDEDIRGRARKFLHRLYWQAQQTIERLGLCGADLVMPVYQPIVPYLKRLRVPRYEVRYNVLNPSHLRRKSDYGLHDPIRIVCVGRLFEEKNPDNLILALADLPGVHLTIVGDGPMRTYLEGVAASAGLAERVEFRPAVANDELCRSLADFDIFAVHTEYWELSKSVLEGLLTGLPMVINRRRGDPVPELTDDICVLVENSVAGYCEALRKLISDHGFRERLGRAACAHAQAYWDPAITEEKFAGIYRRLMLSKRS
jgi:glycosyltransferase involved in cell wall biosynthesis